MDEIGEDRELSDEMILQVQQQRFAARVQRVLEVMREERVDWRGVPFLSQDGRIGVRVMPVDAGFGGERVERGEVKGDGH